MKTDIIKKINNNCLNFLDIMKIENTLNFNKLYLYIIYLIYSNKEYIKILYSIFEKYNILEFFYKYYNQMNDIFDENEKLFSILNKKYQNIIKIIKFLIDSEDSILITINHSLEMSKFIILYSNKKKWINEMNKLDKNSDIVDIFKIAIKGYITCNIIYNYDNFNLKNIDDQNDQVIFVNTYI